MTDEATPRPVRRATVTLAGEIPAARGAVTDDEGRFTFDRLPPGRFTLSARKAAYLPAAYGAARPGRPGTPIQLDASQQVAVTIKMARGGVVTGTIRDGDGQPLPGITIAVASTRKSAASGPPAGSAVTDDRGQYRVYGLMPGEYVVSARPTVRGSGPLGQRTVAEMDALLAEIARRRAGDSSLPDATLRRGPPIPPPPIVGFAPVYFPGVWSADEATPVRLGAGDERAGVDFIVRPIGTGSIEGVITGPVQKLATVQLSITAAGPPSVSSSNANPVLTERPGADGHFKYAGVPPGHYTIMARADPAQTAPPPSSSTQMGIGGRGGPPPPGGARIEYLYARAEIDSRGDEIVGVSLMLQPGSTISGRVRFDATTQPTPDPNKASVTLRSSAGSYMMAMGDGTIIGPTFNGVPVISVAPDGTFVVRGIAPGAYALRASLPPDLARDWWVASALARGRDALDDLVECAPGEHITDVVVTFSDRHSEIAGSLQAPSGLPASEYFVVAFPADRTLWRAGSRRIQSTRPATDGRFAIRDLPSGEYLLAALTDVEPADLEDSTFLEQIVPAAVRITLADGEKKAQDLRIAR